MKKLLFLFISIFIITSCSDEDDTLPLVEPSIIGSWELIKYGTIDNNNIETISDYQNICINKKDYVQYLENGTVIRHTYDDNCTESIATFNWTKIGNIISSDSPSSSLLETEIIELTHTKLKLKFQLFGVFSTNEFRRK